jgi:hypothetical protein
VSFVEFSIAAGALAAQMQSSPQYYRGPAVVYVPPGYSQPMPAPPPAYRAPRPQPRAMTADQQRDAEREAIMDAADRFCAKWPGDKACHPPKDQPVEPPQ